MVASTLEALPESGTWESHQTKCSFYQQHMKEIRKCLIAKLAFDLSHKTNCKNKMSKGKEIPSKEQIIIVTIKTLKCYGNKVKCDIRNFKCQIYMPLLNIKDSDMLSCSIL